MEISVANPAKPPSSSNVSEIINRFAKVCRLRSVGVIINEKVPSEEEYEKIHPIEEDNLTDIKREVHLLSKLFDTVSALKLAYIHLQQAHFPYNPKTIQSADDLVVSKLKTLIDIKRGLKNVVKPKSHSGPLLLDLIRDRENQLDKLQAQIDAKECEIERLKLQVEDLDAKNAELEEKESVRFGRVIGVDLFTNVLEEASKGIHDFAKPLINLMKASGWNLDLAANSIESSIVYSKKSHKKYAFEAYLSRRMFYKFGCEVDNVEDIGKYHGDPLDLVIEDPDSNFAKFCKEKYLMVVHSEMEASFFRNLDHRKLVKEGKHPRTMFYQMFVKMAKWVWLLRVIGAKVEPKAEIFGMRKGSEFSDVYMENVVGDETFEGDGRRNVGFMVMPGFRVGCNVIKSRVFV